MDTDSGNQNGVKQDNEIAKAQHKDNQIQNNHPVSTQLIIAIIGGIFILIAAIIQIAPELFERARATAVPTTAPKLCDDTNLINWNETADHSGEILTVFGPVVDATYSSSAGGKPTFLNIGEAFPEPDRFTVVIWGDDRPKFPENPERFYRGKEICVRGLISEFQGSMQIEINDPSQIEVK